MPRGQREVRRRKLISLLGAALLLVGCAAPLTANVRQIAPEAKSGCTFLSVVEVEGGFFYSSLAEARRDMC